MGNSRKIGIGVAIIVGLAVAISAIGFNLSSTIKENNSKLTTGQTSTISNPDEVQEPQQTGSPQTTAPEAADISNSPINDKPISSQPVVTPSDNPITPSATTEPIFAEPIKDLLPDREDLGTIWQIEYTSMMPPETDEPSSLFEEVQDVTGLKEAIIRGYTIHEDGTYLVKILVARFDTEDNTNIYYGQTKTDVFDEGGFKEYRLSNIDANCFGTFFKGIRIDQADFYCSKENVFYHVYAAMGSNFSAEAKAAIENMPRIVADKI